MCLVRREKHYTIMASVNFQPRYELVYRKSPQNPETKKWYAKAVSNGTVDTEILIKQIAKRCTVTRHDAKAVVSALQEVMSEYIRMGCAVYLEDLGYFRLELKGKGAEKLDNFSSAMISNTMLRFLPSDGMKESVKSLTPNWVSNGVADTEKSRAQAEAESN